jgi:hypothetical protein
MPNPVLTRKQYREAVDAVERNGGNTSAAGRELGLDRRTVGDRLTRGKELGFHLSEGARGSMHAAGMNGVEVQGGYKYVLDDEGRKLETVRWSAPKQAIAAEDMLERIRSAFEGITPAPLVSAPQHTEADLLTTYLISDAHVGMMAWGRETGEDYNTKIAADRIKSWVGGCVSASPPSRTAIILDIGDLTHSDDQTNQTPASKHQLDVDTRHFKTLDVTIEALNCAVELALTKHQKVIVRILPGNHNITAYMAIIFAMSERFRDNPRVKVQKVPGEFFIHEFGQVMIAAHHGHRAKPDRIVHFLADEFAEIWGRTKHRFLWTGHLHHMKAQDIGGVQHEQLRALTARDAYAFSSAYTARAQLQAVTYHRTKGEVSRVKVGCF